MNVMSQMRFRLFGTFQARLAGKISPNLITGKLEELFCFLLLHRQMMTGRESLAALLWGDTSTIQSKKYLRDALWKLQERLSVSQGVSPVLLASPECVRLNPQADVWVDIKEFEAVFLAVEGLRGAQLTAEESQALQHATELYRGDLLEGWYQDWCLCERVRFQEMYQKMLHKLLLWCEANGRYEQGFHYGETILRSDCAHERTHRAMMRLYYRARDRTGAIRQYERCVAALRRELDIDPSRYTIALYELIRADKLESLPPAPIQPAPPRETAAKHLPELMEQYKYLLVTLTTLERQVRQHVEMIERTLKDEE
jgi:DNA-binding SARP family transcriptional activator